MIVITIDHLDVHPRDDHRSFRQDAYAGRFERATRGAAVQEQEVCDSVTVDDEGTAGILSARRIESIRDTGRSASVRSSVGAVGGLCSIRWRNKAAQASIGRSMAWSFVFRVGLKPAIALKGSRLQKCSGESRVPAVSLSDDRSRTPR